jgi:glycosyltransferase involved in cell wall biosynthesis
MAYVGRPKRKCAVVPNAVPHDLAASADGDREALRREAGLPAGVPIAAMVGRLELRKGPLDFVRAAAVAAPLAPDLHFAIFGDGELRPETEALIAELGLGERVHLLGHQPEVRRLLAACDIYVQPSHYEGMSLAMLEALAIGLPMVTTHVDGVDEVAPNGDGALIVPIGDTAALGRAIARAAADPDLRTRMARTTRTRVHDQFNVEAMFARYRAVYRRVLPGYAV